MHDSQAVSIHIAERYATLDDLKKILLIDRCYQPETMGGKWRSKDFKQVLSAEDMAILFSEAGGIAAGFVVIEIIGKHLEIHRLAVEPILLRCGVADSLVHNLKKLMSINGVRRLGVDVPESNLKAQQFFRAQGFKAKLPIHRTKDGDVYRFTYTFADLIGGRKSC